MKFPRLNGRATVEFKFGKPEGVKKGKKFSLDGDAIEEATLKLVVDGYSNPISAGNFIEIVNKGIYNGMKVERADGFTIVAGDTGDKDEHGYRPAPDQKVRRIPLEVGLKGRKEALYG